MDRPNEVYGVIDEDGAWIVVGDGQTDDTESLRRFVQASGHIPPLPEGTYRITLDYGEPKD